MAAAISRHTSTISLVSHNSLNLEAGVLFQCLSRHKDSLESGCERVLDVVNSREFTMANSIFCKVVPLALTIDYVNSGLKINIVYIITINKYP